MKRQRIEAVYWKNSQKAKIYGRDIKFIVLKANPTYDVKVQLFLRFIIFIRLTFLEQYKINIESN